MDLTPIPRCRLLLLDRGESGPVVLCWRRSGWQMAVFGGRCHPTDEVPWQAMERHCVRQVAPGTFGLRLLLPVVRALLQARPRAHALGLVDNSALRHLRVRDDIEHVWAINFGGLRGLFDITLLRLNGGFDAAWRPLHELIAASVVGAQPVMRDAAAAALPDAFHLEVGHTQVPPDPRPSYPRRPPWCRGAPTCRWSYSNHQSPEWEVVWICVCTLPPEPELSTALQLPSETTVVLPPTPELHHPERPA